MGSLSKEKDLFKELDSFLVTIGKLDPKDASIYVLALKKGVIKSRDVYDEFGIRPNAAIARLKALTNLGMLEVAPKETAKMHPYSKCFKAINPRIALKDIVKRSMDLPHLLERYDMYEEEILAESPIQPTEIWIAGSAKAAIRIGASMFSGAKQEIKIYCHDCSWFDEYIDIQESLEDVAKNSISISVIADCPPENTARELTEMGVKFYTCRDFRGPTFCIIDGCWLLLPTQTGTLSKQYSVLRTNDKYIVDEFINLFKTVLSCSKPWGKK